MAKRQDPRGAGALTDPAPSASRSAVEPPELTAEGAADGPEVAATDVVPEPPGGACWVLLEPVGALVPVTCACCDAPAATSRVERQPTGGGSLIVPYCAECLRHVDASGTRSLAVTLASLLLAIALAAGLPIALPWTSLPVILAVVAGAALVPPLVAEARRRRPRAPHTTRGRAARWDAASRLVCTHPGFAQKLAALNGASCVPCAPRWVVPELWPLLGLVCGVAVVPYFHWLHHPLVRVLNLTETELFLSVDGHGVGSVLPSSVEHPLAGVELQLPAGRRLLQARDRDGRLVVEDSALLRSGRHHLYAPGEHPFCFWIEATRYGRGGPAETRIEELDAERHFWVLPAGIDAWFGRNPDSAADRRASGGVLTALRQARCASAPGADPQ